MALRRSRLKTRTTKQLLAKALKQNPDIMEGVMVIGFRIGGSMVVAHNYCCLGHAMNRAAKHINENPEYSAVTKHGGRVVEE